MKLPATAVAHLPRSSESKAETAAPASATNSGADSAADSGTDSGVDSAADSGTDSAAEGAGCVFVVCPSFRTTHPASGDQAQRRELRREEAVRLAQSLGLRVRAVSSPESGAARASTLLPRGRVAELKERLEREPVEVVFIDASLSPSQQRNLETALGCKVLDRTGVILEIFHARARTREGKLQVDLARLAWQRSRVVHSWSHLERQRGGLGKAAGPGERQLELDRRMIEARILQCRHELRGVRRTRAVQRAARRRAHKKTVALVGYTNAGKSTLFNALSPPLEGAGSPAADRLFQTLDPLLRSAALPGAGTILLSDTVGFISDLPTRLVDAFRATLEEVVEADLVLHVRDASAPDREHQASEVRAVLDGLFADVRTAGGHVPSVLEVWNKTDLLSAEQVSALAQEGDATVISALSGCGLDALRHAVARALSGGTRVLTLFVASADGGAACAWLRAEAEVLDEAWIAAGVRVEARLSRETETRFRALWGSARATKATRTTAKATKTTTTTTTAARG